MAEQLLASQDRLSSMELVSLYSVVIRLPKERVYLTQPLATSNLAMQLYERKGFASQALKAKKHQLFTVPYQIVFYIDDTSVLPFCFKFVTKIGTSCCQHTSMNMENAAIHCKSYITQLSSLQKSEMIQSFLTQLTVDNQLLECAWFES